MTWKFWGAQNRSTRPVQWPTREPVRPPLTQDEDEGWLLPRLARDYATSSAPTAADWLAGLALIVVLGLLWLLSALLAG